jgi:hypothetical protein
MNSTAKLVSLIALVVTVAPSLLYFSGMISIESMKWIALAGTIVWFVSTPTWMGRDKAA